MEASITRRELLKRLGFLMGGAAVGCTPVRLALRSYPDAFDHDKDLVERTIAAFVRTVIPGIAGSPGQLTRAFADDYYPFAPYRGFFAADLCRRAEKRYGTEHFDALSLDERHRVIRDGLEGDEVAKRLYTGAIFLAQVACYAGIYDDESGCALIGFEGANGGYDTSEVSYEDPEQYLPGTRTRDGNHA